MKNKVLVPISLPKSLDEELRELANQLSSDNDAITASQLIVAMLLSHSNMTDKIENNMLRTYYTLINRRFTMLRGTRLIEGDEARSFNNVISTFRGLLH